MNDQNPKARPEVLANLSRELFGKALAARVASRLAKDQGREGVWYSHRDYCGHGLAYIDNEYRLLRVQDGMPADSEIIDAWSDEKDFVEWLASQSDFSLSGADDSQPKLHTTRNWDINNQRLNYSRLINYVATTQESYSNKTIDSLAKKRRSDWRRPQLASRRVIDLRKYFAEYGESLRSGFQDWLTVGTKQERPKSTRRSARWARLSGAAIAIAAIALSIAATGLAVSWSS